MSRLIEWLKTERLWLRMKSQWLRGRRLASQLQRRRSETEKGAKALIIPCDPWSVVGSRGDQAMMIACIQRIRAANPYRVIDVMTDSHATDEECRALGLNPIADWNVPLDVWFAAHAAEYAEVYILGADVTDGVYGWTVAWKLLAYYDLFWIFCHRDRVGPDESGSDSRAEMERCKCRVHYLGFSWSKTPSPMMKRVLHFLTPDLPLPVRDPVSYRRLEQFTRHRPLVQVADAAFCLKPKETPRAAHHRAWVDAQHAAGKRVIVLNVHTMFNDAETKSAHWEESFADALQRVQTSFPEVQFLFVPHDNRPRVSDHAILKRLYDKFDSKRAYFVDEVMNADEIKALLGACDGLIAGRMHISIAALGQGVPVLGLVYQGKFEGLWEYFGLDNETLIEPRLFVTDCDAAARKVCSFVGALTGIRKQILASVARVKDLARRNFP